MRSETKNERLEQRKKEAEAKLVEQQAKAEFERIAIDKIHALTSVLETVIIEPSSIPGGECKIKSALSPNDRSKVRKKMFEIIDKL